jgi:capsular exopolysaccharide synthesis family protein
MVPSFRKRPKEELPPPAADEQPPAGIRREELVVARDPTSALAEHYRRLRSSVEALNPEGVARTLMLTSALSHEGKSVATLNLALCLAERPRTQVLVLEADLRRPSVEGYLGLPRRQGLSEVLTGRLSIERAIRRTSEEGLDVIGAGTVPENPSKVLRIDRLKQVLHALKQRYDYVLIDSPPAHALTDSSVVGSVADGILLVVKLGGTPRHLVDETVAQLESSGGKLLGVCLLGAKYSSRAYDSYSG